MKGIVFTTDNRMFERELKQPLYKSLQEAVGGYFEIVHAVGLEWPYCFICDEEGLLKGLPLNVIGSIWYGTGQHGHPIVGNIVVMKETDTDDGQDIVGLEEDEIRHIKHLAIEISEGLILDMDNMEG